MEGRSLFTVEKHLERITVGQLVEFCEFSKEKYHRAKIEPGIIAFSISSQLDGSNNSTCDRHGCWSPVRAKYW